MPPITLAESRVLPGTADAVYSATLTLPLPLLFAHWYGPLPPIAAVRDQTGEWGELHQTRTVALKGGGTMREELTSVEPSSRFAYRLTAITGAMGPLVDRIDGAWEFGPAGTGISVTWRWTIHPKSAVVRPAVVMIGRLWHGYARRALGVLEAELKTQ